MKKAYITFNDRARNSLLGAGKGWMVFDVTMTHSVKGARGVHWTAENNFLERPDHASVASQMCNDIYALEPGAHIDCTLIYAIVPPYVGRYTFGLMGGDLAPVARSIVVR